VIIGRIYRHSRESGLRCIGMPADVQFAMWLLDSLADYVFGELYGHLIGCLAPRSERRVIMRSFVESCTERISDRLMALVKRSQKVRRGNGKELVVIRDAAIKAFMQQHDIRLHTCGGSASSHVDAAASRAGRAAGDRATFGRPVTGAAGVLRIGKS
jgi:hypothetical protein